MIVNRNYICKDEFIGNTFKNKEKYFKSCIKSKSEKYKAKNTSLVDRHEMFRQELNEGTQLSLKYSTYDDDYGFNCTILELKIVEHIIKFRY